MKGTIYRSIPGICSCERSVSKATPSIDEMIDDVEVTFFGGAEMTPVKVDETSNIREFETILGRIRLDEILHASMDDILPGTEGGGMLDTLRSDRLEGTDTPFWGR